MAEIHRQRNLTHANNFDGRCNAIKTNTKEKKSYNFFSHGFNFTKQY